MLDKVWSKIRSWFMTDVPISISAQHIGWILAAIIVADAGFFTLGYYWGKKTGAKQLCSTINRDAFADQIYNSLCLAAAGLIEDENNDENYENDNVELITPSEDTENGCVDNCTESELEETEANVCGNKPLYYAQLAGFTCLDKAESFVSRLQKRRVPSLIKERTSKNSKGQLLTWYQVVTEQYEDQDALNSIVAILKNEEKLHDALIVQG